MSDGLLIDLLGQALGTEPCGVVDYNHLHRLLLEMIGCMGKLAMRYPTNIAQEIVEPKTSPNVESTTTKRDDENDVSAIEAKTSRIAPEEADSEKSDSKEEGRAKSGEEPDVDDKQPVVVVESTPLFGSRAVGAGNVVSVLENKLRRLEEKMNGLAVLPEMLEKSVVDGGKPVHDMWIATSLGKRVDGTEEGLRKTCSVLDDVLNELQQLKELRGDVRDIRDRLGKLETDFGRRIEAVEEKDKTRAESLAAMNERLASLEKQPASDGGPSLALVNELQTKMNTMTSEIATVKKDLASRALKSDVPNNAVTTDDLEERLKAALSQVPSAEEVENMKRQLKELEKAYDELSTKIKEVQESLSEKVSSSDLASLMPQGGGGDVSENVTAILLELQTRVTALESRLNELASQQASMKIPADLTSDVVSLRERLDGLVSSLEELKQDIGSLSEGNVPRDSTDYGAQLLKVRERLEDIEKALSSLSETVAQSLKATPPPENPFSQELLDTLHRHLHEIQAEQDKHADFMRRLAEEVAIKEDHIKSLYSGLGDLKDTKADRHFVEAEVHNKADQKSVENKANRAWVDSTFSKLDSEIREARQKLLVHEEALQRAVNQLSTDVDSKLDRMELEPLKQYLETRIETSISAPISQQPEREDLDPAGLRKGLNFNCLSCDRPVIVHPPRKPMNTLPVSKSLPNHRSIRAYTTYELDLIRQHHRRGLSEVLLLPPSLRSCGGAHTLTSHPPRRVHATRSMHVYAEDEYGVPLFVDGEETEIVGHDGHVYKGRVAPTNKLPSIKRSMSAKGINRSTRHSRSPPNPTRPHSPKNQKQQTVPSF
ncbi:glutamine-rich protein 2-like [Oscarella lobularis]|uniref:glutamine-rich protein 2-like n=1 Tax=Oscarella lobularis TaxID=121494 RepID=UPI003313CF24